MAGFSLSFWHKGGTFGHFFQQNRENIHLNLLYIEAIQKVYQSYWGEMSWPERWYDIGERGLRKRVMPLLQKDYFKSRISIHVPVEIRPFL